MMDPKASFSDFSLYVAIRKSRETAGFYERLSHSTKIDELKAFFNEMARRKHEEASCLQTRYDPVPGIFPEEEKLSIHSVFSEEKIDAGAINTIQDACQFALNLELVHFRFYARLAQLEPETKTKELFLFILQMHRPSLAFLETRLQSCRVNLNAEAEHEKTGGY